MSRSTVRLSGLAIAAALICLPAASPAAAQSGQSGQAATAPARVFDPLDAAGIARGTASLRAPSGDGGDAFAVVIAVTTPPSLDAQTPIAGYAEPPIGIVYTWTGNAIDATDDAILLQKNGTYQVHLDAALVLHSEDGSVHPRAGANFYIIVNGQSLPNVSCLTETARDARARPSSTLAPGNPYTTQMDCNVTGTIQVRNQGSAPYVFAKGATVQAFVVPDERFEIGEATFTVVRMEVTKIGS